MMRSVVIFSFFALATVLVIVLQPGPRSTYAYETGETLDQETSRNQSVVLDTGKAMPTLEAPDDVLGRLKAAAKPQSAPVQPAPQTNGASELGSLSRLQAALDASLGNGPVASHDAPTLATRVEPVAAPAPTNYRANSTYGTATPELRDMSWQTLNTLNSLGHEAKGPGQEGSLLNSIVRRSMGQVGSSPAPVRAAAPAPRAAPVQRAAVVQPVNAALTTPAPSTPRRRQSAVQSTYVVASGDTLALIAIKLYGTALAIDDLLAQNPSLRKNPNSLRIGQVLQYASN